MGGVEVYRTEWCIYAPDEDVAGSIDMVLKHRDSAVFFLWTGSVVKNSRTSTWFRQNNEVSAAISGLLGFLGLGPIGSKV